jgi:hypothetical protein
VKEDDRREEGMLEIHGEMISTMGFRRHRLHPNKTDLIIRGCVIARQGEVDGGGGATSNTYVVYGIM